MFLLQILIQINSKILMIIARWWIEIINHIQDVNKFISRVINTYVANGILSRSLYASYKYSLEKLLFMKEKTYKQWYSEQWNDFCFSSQNANKYGENTLKIYIAYDSTSGPGYGSDFWYNVDNFKPNIIIGKNITTQPIKPAQNPFCD